MSEIMPSRYFVNALPSTSYGRNLLNHRRWLHAGQRFTATTAVDISLLFMIPLQGSIVPPLLKSRFHQPRTQEICSITLVARWPNIYSDDQYPYQLAIHDSSLLYRSAASKIALPQEIRSITLVARWPNIYSDDRYPYQLIHESSSLYRSAASKTGIPQGSIAELNIES
ncbi:hypothetical protein BDZ89DRAFT_1137277 [Hymenopellis radicata]|nr:hypothetical protein BDZ89DRAFT_1137277 [Hymenopellis radicata]